MLTIMTALALATVSSAQPTGDVQACIATTPGLNASAAPDGSVIVLRWTWLVRTLTVATFRTAPDGVMTAEGQGATIRHIGKRCAFTVVKQ